MGSHLWVPFEGQRSNNGEHDDVHIFLVLSFSLIRFLLFPLPFPLLSPLNLGAAGGGEGVFFFCSWEKEDVRERGGTTEGRLLRLSPTIPPIQLPPNVLFTIFYYLPPKDSSPYNSFSPTIPPISIPTIHYTSLFNYLFIIFKFWKK